MSATLFNRMRARFLRRLDSDAHYPARWLGILFFTVISGWATFRGLMAFEGQNMWIAAAFTLGVQFSIIFTARQVGLVRGLGRLPWVGLLVLLWAFSTGMATAYWWGVMAARSYAERTFAADTEQLIRPLQGFAVAYAALSQELARLSEYSQARAQQEVRRGGTCGDGSGRGAGPRQRLRLEDARLFAGHARRLRQRAEIFGRMVAALEQQLQGFDVARRVDIQAQVQRVQRQALAMRHDGSLDALRADLKAQLDKHTRGVRDRRGQLVRCPDARLEAGIARVMQRLKVLPEVPERPITVYGPERSRNVNKLYEEFLTFLSGGRTTLSLQEVAAPLAFGFLPDVIILALSLGLARIEGGGGRGGADGRGLRLVNMQGEARRAARAFEREMAKPDTSAAGVLRAASVRISRRRTTIIVPEGAPVENKLAHEVRRLAEMLEGVGHIRFVQGGFPVEGLRRAVRERLAAVLKGVRHVSIYHAQPLIAAAFNNARMLEALEAANGKAPVPPASSPATRADEEGPEQAEEEAHRVVIMADDDGHFRAIATFNGTVSIQSMIDTGATGISIPHAMAKLMGIDIGDLDYSITTRTANGKAKVAPVMLKSVCIGDICVRNVPATVSQPGKLDEPLIGMRFLKALRRFEVQGNRLVLEG